MSELKEAINGIKLRRRAILSRRGPEFPAGTSLDCVRRIVIINSSSRSGSSLLYALLGRLPQVMALTGEASPFYKLNSAPDLFEPHNSDRIPTELLDRAIDLEGLSADFLADIYTAETAATGGEIDADRYVDDLMLRFLLQWTDIEPDEDELRRLIGTTLDRYCDQNGTFSTEEFYLELLEELNKRWPQVNPFYYDIGTDKVALRFPSLEIPSAPPVSSFTIEEPPFILLPPRKRVTPHDFENKTLLLKSTVDCYRMNLVERLFPKADIRIIHLVRNPAATINGIFDGWHHRGFFSHNLGNCFGSHTHVKALRIKGYSDVYPFGTVWWNFDLPLGWEKFADRDLVEVCAFQWLSANSEILDHLASGRRRCCTVHFEDIIRSKESRTVEFARMLEFMNVSSESADILGLDRLPVVQSTLPPQLFRWKRREEMIARVLAAPRIREMAAIFGYQDDNREEWL
jgi:hypothetical protein